jgi:hypothetical protein
MLTCTSAGPDSLLQQKLDSHWTMFFKPLSTLQYFEILIVDDTQRIFDPTHRLFDDEYTLVTQERALEISKAFFSSSSSLRRVAWTTDEHREKRITQQEYPHVWYARDFEGASVEYRGLDMTCNDAWRTL